MEIPEVAQAYEDCQQGGPQNSQKMDECIWNRIKGHSEVKEKIEKIQNPERFESIPLATLRQARDPAMEKLQQYLSKRLEEAIYGEVQKDGKKMRRMVAHDRFLKLYKSQIGKNIILTLSSYCLDTDPNSSKHLIPKDKDAREKARKDNIERLGRFNASRENMANSRWVECVQEIQNICSKDNINSKYEGSRQRACVVTDYVKAARQNLIILATIEKAWDNVKKEKKGGRFIVENIVEYDGKKDDDLTSISSNELLNTSGFKEANENLAKNLEERCLKGGEEDECAQYISQNKEELEKLLGEYRLRSFLVQKKVEDMKKEDIENYLKDEGYSEEQIALKLQDEDAIKEQITKNYRERREKLIAHLQSKIIESSVEKGTNFDASKRKLEAIHQELLARPERYKQLVHFNNIVSGYLSFESSETQKNQERRNIQSIVRELKDSAYAVPEAEGKGRSPVAADPFQQRKESIEQELEDDGGGAPEQKSEGIYLGVERINETLLRYRHPNVNNGSGSGP